MVPTAPWELAPGTALLLHCQFYAWFHFTSLVKHFPEHCHSPACCCLPCVLDLAQFLTLGPESTSPVREQRERICLCIKLTQNVSNIVIPAYSLTKTYSTDSLICCSHRCQTSTSLCQDTVRREAGGTGTDTTHHQLILSPDAYNKARPLPGPKNTIQVCHLGSRD